MPIAITTVSESFRRDMLTPEGGCGLDVVLRENAHQATRDFEWRRLRALESGDRCLAAGNLRSGNVGGKMICRDVLLDAFGLAPAPDGPVFGMVTRLVAEKGFDVLMPVLDRLLSDDVRLIILGEGDPAYRNVRSRSRPRNTRRSLPIGNPTTKRWRI